MNSCSQFSTLISKALLKSGISLWHGALTMMNNSIFQQCLSQVDPFLRFAYLPNLCEPRYKLTAKESRTETIVFFSLNISRHISASPQPTTGDTVLEACVKTVVRSDSSSVQLNFVHFWQKCSAEYPDLLFMTFPNTPLRSS